MATIRKPYSKRERKGIEILDPSMTKQSFKDDSDINNIMNKYQRTGALDYVNKSSPNFGFATSLDLRESLEIINTANEMFNSLPSSIRKKFENDPEKFLDFAQNPDNASEMAEMGLTEQEATKAQETSERLSKAKIERSEPENSASPEQEVG